MKKKTKYIFIDESGEPDFFAKGGRLMIDQPGYQPLFLMGMIVTDDRKLLRKSVLDFQDEILNDKLYNTIYTVKQPGWYLHAKDDHPEVRAKFFEHIRNTANFKTFVVIGRKLLSLFLKHHKGDSTVFYFDVLYHLIKDRLNKDDEKYKIYLSHRKKRSNEKLRLSIEKAVERDNTRRNKPIFIDYNYEIVMSSDFPELSIIDYMLWALQRYIIFKEERFYEALKDKFALIIDLYDRANYKTNYYRKENPFSLDKASSFK